MTLVPKTIRFLFYLVSSSISPGTRVGITSRAGMAGAVSRWLGSVEDLSEIAQRLLRVQIEHALAIEVIKRYDSEETLFYCDPPYPHDSRTDINAYAFEMTNKEHEELAEVLHNVKGKVALSSYHCNLMNDLYSDWRYVEGPLKKCHSVKTPRTEVLWVNYDIEENNGWQHQQKSLIPLFNEPLATLQSSL